MIKWSVGVDTDGFVANIFISTYWALKLSKLLIVISLPTATHEIGLVVLLAVSPFYTLQLGASDAYYVGKVIIIFPF